MPGGGKAMAEAGNQIACHCLFPVCSEQAAKGTAAHRSDTFRTVVHQAGTLQEHHVESLPGTRSQEREAKFLGW